MLVNIYGAKCIGIDAVRVTAEIDVTRGIGVHLVGLADAVVKESLLRTTTALQALGFRIPGKKIVINLAPADLRKNGSGYDLSIALGILAASEQVRLPLCSRYLVMGELGLDGSVRDVSGALPFVELAMEEGFDGIILPTGSALEAVEFRDIKVYAVRTLSEALQILSGQQDCSGLLVWNTPEYRNRRLCGMQRPYVGSKVDFSDIIGQEGARRGMEIAAAGGHNLLMIGPPGSGKSSMAKALAGILPPLTREESLVTSKIHSIAGRGYPGCGLVRERPFRAPHYSASLAAIVGGGNGDNIMPGEISLAQNGVLFLDEAAQMPRSVIEALRGPLEDRKVTISRLRSKIEYPASFMLIAASNPCPCGYYGEGDRCTCTPVQRLNYISRLSGPIMDRIDIQLALRPVASDRILSSGKAESSAAIAERVKAARMLQAERFAPERETDSGNNPILVNAEMNNRQMEKYCPLDTACREMMSRLMTRMGLSMRAYFRIVRVARTIADLAGSSDIKVEHLAEAASFRFLDRQKEF